MTQTMTEDQNTSIELISVSEALRKHIGRMRVRGTITSLTKLFKMIVGFKAYCDKCNKLNEVCFPEPVFSIKYEDRKCTNSNCQKLINNVNYDYCNAVIVELQDLEQFNDLERLSVYLFDENTENIRVGENVIVNGQIQINELNGKKKLFPYLYVESIEYDKNDKITLTELDIDPKYDKLITSLRTAYAEELKLKKDIGSYSDLLDALRLALKGYGMT